MYAELHEVEYTRLRRSLIRKSAKGTHTQREFLDAVRDSKRFLAFVMDRVSVQEGD